jgi:predicted glycoside hydrolase/deacetylase ChbG (UPF0249 family)
LALENPGLDVGIHLVLVDEAPLLKPEDLSTLVSQGGRLPGRNRILEGHRLSRNLDYGQVEAEWCAQVEKALKRGIRSAIWTVTSSSILFPGLFNVSLGISRRYHIPFMRGVMMEPSLLSRFDRPGDRPSHAMDGLWGWTRFMALAGCFPNGTIPSVGFLNAGGRMDCGTLLAILDKLAKDQSCNLVEFMLHPGMEDKYPSKIPPLALQMGKRSEPDVGTGSSKRA